MDQGLRNLVGLRSYNSWFKVGAEFDTTHRNTLGTGMKQLLVFLAMMVLAGCGGKTEQVLTPEPSAETSVTVMQGAVTGFIADNGTHVWRGVPYGADTSGENRWRAPRPAPGWTQTRNAISFAPVCPQIATPFTPIASFTDGELEGSEDCLAMDIYAPADAKGKNLPVMVWIHGGSNVSGASQLYVGDHLAANENVIVMSVQYRLGPLGWFSHPALVESAETEADKSANFGILDLIAALQWVQDNAQVFGGNPDNVTIFGESAGGHNVVSLLAAKKAEGLFHRAIIQSGSFDSVSVDEARGLAGNEPNPSLDVAEKLGGADKFHTASLDEVFAAFELDAQGFMEMPRIIMDGVLLPETPLRDTFASTNNYNVVPTISGINRDEMKLFNIFDERLTKTKFGKFVMARDQAVYDAASEYGSRNWRVRSVDAPLAMMQSAGHEDIYAYQFDWDEGGKMLWTDLSKMLGAAHAVEIPFVFNRFELLGDLDKIMFHKKTKASRETLSRSMGAYWAAFARTGTPAISGLPDWPTYGTGHATMHFDSANDGGVRVEEGAETADRLIDDLEQDNRVNTGEQCQIAAFLDDWMLQPNPQLDTIKSC
jgi:para-nitrobenzyl esterase